MDHFDIKLASYNFSEAGHGKSVADGVGRTIKRTADQMVLKGKDDSNIDEFLAAVGGLKHLVIQVDDNSIKDMDKLLEA